MAQLQRVAIAQAVLQQGEQYLLQLRGTIPGIGAAGLIGFFGGKIEDGETPLQAAFREVHEETTAEIDLADGRIIGEVVVESDMKGKQIEVHATAVHFVVSDGQTVEAREGTLVRLDKTAALQQIAALTPATKACFEVLL